MKRVTLCLAALLSLSMLSPAQHAALRGPIYSSFDTDHLAAPPTPPPPRTTAQPPNLERVQRDADELVSLAKSVSGDVGQTRKGMRPRDLNENLKKIEKLAKHLRGELAL